MENFDVDVASNKLANMSFQERSPLQVINSNSRPLEHAKKFGSETNEERERIRFSKLVKKAKYLAQDGKVREALELNRQALQIHYHEKLAKRIAKMEEYLKNYGDEDDEENSNMVELGAGFFLYRELYSKLYEHQKEGIMWLWGLHKKEKGGILGDDMGLGKTIQVISFLSGLFDMEKIKTALVVAPVSVMINWEKEFSKWAPGIAVHTFHGNSKRERERALDRVRLRGGVLLTTYGMVVTSWEQLANKDGREFVWDYVILDEGHKIKNPTKTTKGINAVGAKHRIIMTGTPVQNNLKELWVLFDYVHQGSLLGTLRTFKMEFENPIVRAREKDATAGEKHLGMEMAQTLKDIIAPYFLRRTKGQVNHSNAKNPSDKICKMPEMTFKNDFVIWLYLSDTQVKMYNEFLQSESVKELLMTSRSPLVALTILKKICDHPRLLSLRACHEFGLYGQDLNEDELELPSSLESAASKIKELPDSVLIEEAGKIGVLLSLLDRLRDEGHRCLVFSQSRKIIDILQKLLKNKGHKVMRLDGTITKLSNREECIQKFQQDGSYTVFLLTTQVGGVGLTLTAADRVVIYDPSWNPATDAQAVDRAFRIGQTRNVVVYRLITCGTVEEKIYRRQIFKDSINRQATGGEINPYRYFTKQELRELFQLGDTRSSTTQQQLEELHGLDRRRDPELDTHIAFLYSLDIFGISDHDLMFSQEVAHEEEFENKIEVPETNLTSREYVKHRVQKAREILEHESSVPGTIEQRMATKFSTMSVYAEAYKRDLMKSTPVMKANPSLVQQANTKFHEVPLFKPTPADTSRSMFNRLPEQKGRQSQMLPLNPPPRVTTQPKELSQPENIIDLTECEDDSLSKPTSIKVPSLNHDQHIVLSPINIPASPKPVYNTVLAPVASTPRSDNHTVVEEELFISPTAYTPLMETRQKRRRITNEIKSPAALFLKKALAFSVEDEPRMLSTEHSNDDKASQSDEYGSDTKASQLDEPGSEAKVKELDEHRSEAKVKELDEHRSEAKVKELDEHGNEAKVKELDEHGNEGKVKELDEHRSEAKVKELDEHTNDFKTFESNTHDTNTIELVECADTNPSESDEEHLIRKPRRSVCRRVAVIESSEEEDLDDENKENLHPSLLDESQIKQYHSREGEICYYTHGDRKLHGDDGQKDDDSGSDQSDDEFHPHLNDEEYHEEHNPHNEKSHDAADQQNDDDDGSYHSVADQGYNDDKHICDTDESDHSVTDQENEADEHNCADDNQEEDSDQQVIDNEQTNVGDSVMVYDESIISRGSEESDDQEDEEEMKEEESVDMERLQQLLKDGKMLYQQKRYKESKALVLAAMEIVNDPFLQDVADKIQRKIDAGL